MSALARALGVRQREVARRKEPERRVSALARALGVMQQCCPKVCTRHTLVSALARVLGVMQPTGMQLGDLGQMS